MIYLRIGFPIFALGVIALLVLIHYHKSGKKFPWGWTLSILVIIAIVLGVGLWINGCRETAKAEKRVASEMMRTNPPPKIVVVPSVIDATTPARLTLDFHFRIESDGPVNIEYPGEKPMLYTPGRGFQQMPQPKQAGPKVFTDPTDPTNGHTAFRIYPIR